MNRLSRRRFLTGSLTGLVAAPLLVPAGALGKDGTMAPSERITIAMFGAGSRGSHAINVMRPLPDHQILAIAEAQQNRAERALGIVNAMYADRMNTPDYKACKIYADFRDALERDDIDTVFCTAPDHWHGPMFSRIVKAGKDLYGEKPLARYVSQGVELCKLVRQYGCVFQTGTQQRSCPRFRLACELARNGYLGKVHTIEVAVPCGRAFPAVAPSDPPAGFDWDMWTGPAPLFPFDKQRSETYARYMISHYCAGFITNWGVHYLDIAGWGIPDVFEKPFEIEGTGTMPDSGITDTWLSWNATLRYANDLKIDFSSAEQNRNECRFIGDEGRVFVNRDKIEAEPKSLLDVKFKDSDVRLHASPWAGNAITSHSADFFRSVRTRQDPASPVEAGHVATAIGNATDIALRLERKLKWSPSENRFDGDDQANQMLTRAERSPWTM